MGREEARPPRRGARRRHPLLDPAFDTLRVRPADGLAAAGAGERHVNKRKRGALLLFYWRGAVDSVAAID